MLLRPARRGDEMAVARVHVRSWQVGYRTLLPDDYLDQLRPEDRAARYAFESADPNDPFTLVAEEDGLIRGFATVGRGRDQDRTGWGELYALYVDPGCWGTGIGTALTSAACGHLIESGYRDALLWVIATNVRAQRFYEREGWSADGQSRTENVWGIDVDSVRYARGLARSS